MWKDPERAIISPDLSFAFLEKDGKSLKKKSKKERKCKDGTEREREREREQNQIVVNPGS